MNAASTTLLACLLVWGCGSNRTPVATPAPSPTPAASVPSVPPPAPTLSATEPGSSVGSQPSVPPCTCTLAGLAVPARHAELRDEQGRVLAELSGAPVPMTVSGVPSSRTGMFEVKTGEGRGELAIAGRLAAPQLALFAASELPVVGSVVRLAPGARLELVSASSDQITAVRPRAGVFDQEFSVTARCDGYSLTRLAPTVFSPTHQGLRGYVLRAHELDLFAEPAALGPVLRLVRARGGEGVLFTSPESQGDWVRIQYFSEVLIDAWVRASDLERLPDGELVDQPEVRTITEREPARLVVKEHIKVVRFETPIPLRGSASESAAPIGLIEPYTELFVLDLVAGWASILPKSLSVLPPDGKSFWVRSREVGL